MDPAHPLATRLGPGHIEGRGGRINTDDLDPTIGQPKREHARPTTDIQHPTRPELLDHTDVRIEIAAIGINGVVDRSEPRMPEQLVSHATERIRR